MATFHFELVSPERLVFAGEVDQVDVPGEEGEFGVFAGHAPYIATLKPGMVAVVDFLVVVTALLVALVDSSSTTVSTSPT